MPKRKNREDITCDGQISVNEWKRSKGNYNGFPRKTLRIAQMIEDMVLDVAGVMEMKDLPSSGMAKITITITNRPSKGWPDEGNYARLEKGYDDSPCHLFFRAYVEVGHRFPKRSSVEKENWLGDYVFPAREGVKNDRPD